MQRKNITNMEHLVAKKPAPDKKYSWSGWETGRTHEYMTNCMFSFVVLIRRPDQSHDRKLKRITWSHLMAHTEHQPWTSN